MEADGRRRTSLGALVAILGVASCMGPSGQIERVDRAIRERIDGIPLPRASRSALEPIPEGVRVLLHDDAVELDDVTAWLSLGEEVLGRQMTERGGPPWTHVPSLALPAVEGEGVEALAHPALLDAMTRVHEGASAAVQLRGAGEPNRFTVLIDHDASFIEVVRVLYNAIRAGMTPPRFGVRGTDGTLGTLSSYVTRYCVEGEEPAHPHSGRQCWRPEVIVLGSTIAVRGREIWESAGKCLNAKRFEPRPIPPGGLEDTAKMMKELEDEDVEDVWAKLSGEDVGTRRIGLGSRRLIGSPRTDPVTPPPPPPAPPCRTVALGRVEQDPTLLRQAIEEIATEEPCSQAEVTSANDVPWQDVVTAFDVVRSLGYANASLTAPDRLETAGCEPTSG